MVACVPSPSTITSIGSLTRDPIGYGTAKSLYANELRLDRLDPDGLFSITASDASCPGCGKAAVMWKFKDGGWDEWFLVQYVCTVQYVQECKMGCGCEPDKKFKACRRCFYEKLPMKDGVGRDLWRFPFEGTGKDCGTIGFGVTVAEVRTFSGSIVDNDQWENEGEIEFCSLPSIRVSKHRDAPPSYWGKSTNSYRSMLFTIWDCCSMNNTSGSMSFGSTGGEPFTTISCGNGTPPKRQGEITW